MRFLGIILLSSLLAAPAVAGIGNAAINNTARAEKHLANLSYDVLLLKAKAQTGMGGEEILGDVANLQEQLQEVKKSLLGAYTVKTMDMSAHKEKARVILLKVVEQLDKLLEKLKKVLAKKEK